MLLDWQMPKVSGIELMAGMVKNSRNCLLFPSSWSPLPGSDENKRAAHQVNPNLAGYLVKPYKPEELLTAINPFLR